MSSNAKTTGVCAVYRRAAQRVCRAGFAVGLSIGGSLSCATAENPPTPEQLEAIRAHQSANKSEIAEGERKFRKEKTDYVLKNFAESGARGWIVSLRELNLPFEEGSPLFSKFLSHSNPEVVAESIFSLSELYGPRAIGSEKEIFRAYENDNDLVAFEAARSFPKLGVTAEAAVPRMSKKLQSGLGSQRLRIITIQTLGSFGASSADALPSLQKELASPDSNIAYEAFLAIGKIKSSSSLAVQKLDISKAQTAVGEEAYSLLSAIRQGSLPREKAITVLQSALQENKFSRPAETMAVETLGRLAPNDSTSLGLLLTRVGSADPTLSQIANEAAQKFVTTDLAAVKTCADELENADDRIGTAAANILIRFGERAAPAGPQTVRALKKMTSTSDIYRIGALIDLTRSLSISMEEAVPFLLTLLQENAPIYQQMSPEYAAEIRTFALLTLSRIGLTLEAWPAIIDILANTTHPKEFAVAAIAATALPPGKERTATIKYLTRALSKEYPDTLVTLKRFGIIPNAEEPENNTSARVEAARALAAIGGPDAQKTIPLLKERAADPWTIFGLKESYQAESNKAIALLSR